MRAAATWCSRAAHDAYARARVNAQTRLGTYVCRGKTGNRHFSSCLFFNWGIYCFAVVFTSLNEGRFFLGGVGWGCLKVYISKMMLSAIKLQMNVSLWLRDMPVQAAFIFHTNQLDFNVLDFSLIFFHHKYRSSPPRLCMCVCIRQCWSAHVGVCIALC